jgi:hypothetical protein
MFPSFPAALKSCFSNARTMPATDEHPAVSVDCALLRLNLGRTRAPFVRVADGFDVFFFAGIQ